MLPYDPHGPDTPAYDLERIQQLVGQGELSRVITGASRQGADQLGFEEPDIVAAVLGLTPTCFYKSMEAEKRPGLWQDVYHLHFRAMDLYIKLQIDPDGFAIVVQFKKR
ncbi:MAG TPA: type II toxin-antitoxin system MqsR family toxin [Longimicrobium sp.]|nr:type II toxin-antitoxin system MqsR family toxin [Longimicrobium sp.]